MGLIIGFFIGVFLMCLVQINKTNELNKEEERIEEIQEDFLHNKAQLVKINDLVDEYRNDNSKVYRVIRDITNIVKGW